MDGNRRVVITGVGPVAPNGIGREAYWDALMHGRSGIRRITGFDASAYACQIAGEVVDFQPEAFIEPRLVKRLARFSQLAVAAGRLAMEDAGLPCAKGPASACRGVCLGVSNNAFDHLEREFETFLNSGCRRTNPALFTAGFPHAAASEVAVACACEGPATTVSAGCAAGAAAIVQAFEEIRQGRVDVMLAGGTDASVSRFLVAIMCSSRILPTGGNDAPEEVSRPFDSARGRGVLSEGAGIVVMEDLERALARRAPIYGEILGCAGNTEALGVFEMANDDTYLERSMRRALGAAGLHPRDVDHISAHGPSDVSDAKETKAIKAVFGEHAYNLAVSSIKSMIGNPLSAAAPLQVIATAMALREQRVPPTINYTTPDPECGLDYVPNQPRACRLKVALVNAHGLGGANYCIAMGRYPRTNPDRFTHTPNAA